VIGARDAENPALKIAREVCARYPHIPSRIVLSGIPTWPNAKSFSLDKMLATAKHSFLVLSDSDVEVGSDMLKNVIPPLLDPANGAVTCIYQGIPAGDSVSLLEGLGMSVEMTSGVIVADMLEGMRFALGIIIAVRREALDAIGGIRMTANYYSDDFVLGNEVWKAGYKVVLSHYKADHVLLPRGWWDTIGDQLRWMKSTRYSRPAGHVGTGLTFAVRRFGVDRRDGHRRAGCGVDAAQCSVDQSHDSMRGGWLGRNARSAGAAILLALSAARLAWFWNVDGKLL
jgi:ceramide glucosyltransferase